MIEAADDVEPTTTNVHSSTPAEDVPAMAATASTSASPKVTTAADASEIMAATVPPVPPQEQILDFNSPEVATTEEDVEGDGGPKSSLENIIPMDKIKRG